jgi:hypothetical protein
MTAHSHDCHDLFPSYIRQAIPPLGATEGQGGDAVAWARIFTPRAGWTWYVLECDGRDICFGLVAGIETELGYFSLAEIEQLRGPGGRRAERDASFHPTPLRQLPECPPWLQEPTGEASPEETHGK